MNSLISTPELLAPAGDFERLTAAVRFGADAVYLGGTGYGMRAASANFDFETLAKAVDFAHQRGVKVYLTCNSVPTNEEADGLDDYLRQAEQAGVDALIIADVGVMAAAKEVVPKLEIHMSTQVGIVNYRTANELYRMGAKRVVLARELSLEDIRTIRRNTPSDLELEVFVHGAVCMSFSGRCLLSQYIVGRDANRGECAQPCRWGYHLVEEKRPGQYFPLYEDERGSYILNAKDLCLIEHLGKLLDAGVTSLKIEGRAKSSYYVSVITNAYRIALDGFVRDPSWQVEPWLLDEVCKVSHRRYDTGCLFGRPEDGQYTENGGYLRNFDVVAVADKADGEFLFCTQRNKFSRGDTVELLEPGKRPFELRIAELYDGEGNPVEAACHPMMKLRIPFAGKVAEGAILRKQK